jgi:hypothetical protein
MKILAALFFDVNAHDLAVELATFGLVAHDRQLKFLRPADRILAPGLPGLLPDDASAFSDTTPG